MNGENIGIYYEAFAFDWQADIAYCFNICVENLSKATRLPRFEPLPLPPLSLLQRSTKEGKIKKSVLLRRRQWILIQSMYV